MSTATLSVAFPPTVLPGDWSLAELQQHLGEIPLERIRLFPPPGMATEADAVELNDRNNRLFELIDGVLVEKTMGGYESLVAVIVAHKIATYLDSRRLGVVLGADGLIRLLPGQIRMPDLTFFAWDRFPRGLPREPAWPCVPDLAVEVLSRGNSAGEMQRKLREYFQAGTKLVWYIDPQGRTATAYEAVDQATEMDAAGSLDGGVVLPGFRLPLAELFEAGPPPPGNATAETPPAE